MIVDILALLGLGAIAIEIAYHSDLAAQIKRWVGLSEDMLKPCGILATFKFWLKFLPKWLWLLSIIPVTFFTIWHKIIELTNCPWCTGFWLAFGYLLIRQYEIIPAIALTGITLISVYLIQAIDRYVNK